MKRTILGNLDERAKRLPEEELFGKESGQVDSYDQMLKCEGRTGSPAIGRCPIRPGASAPSTSSSNGAHKTESSRIEEVGKQAPQANEESCPSRCPLRRNSKVEEPSSNQQQDGPKRGTIDGHSQRYSRL
eukprot:GHVS01102758.1.p1 GENE.GHVS01102758.1~~GHVS01102758.1.p1  ORF type:complete len:130 (+),score=18.68 GHVS01102758.1:2209-2598(+)